MGSKTRAREIMAEAGVPIVPGTTDPVETVEDARKVIADSVGYPVAIKAAGGGGGKGFRVAESEDELEKAFEGASREGEKFFSDATVYVERYLPDPRHVEVQVLADDHGNVIHLFERDCSVQRRHQKLIEESPAPAVDPELRERIGKIGTDAARAVGYRSAGTIEGLLQDGEYFFLEMNTRVQVEHCVTEMVTGIDIVREQIKIAAGEPLGYSQDDVVVRGHAIECRINAEDASKNFAPAPGRVGSYREPAGPFVRVDSGAEEGYEVLPLYDPMIAKLIVWDVDREASTKRMIRALGEYEIGGLKTLIPFHQALLATEQWANGETCRDLVEDKEWLKQLAFPARREADGGGRAREGLARVRRGGLRTPLRRDRDRRGARRQRRRRRPKKAPKRERKSGGGGGAPGELRLADPGHRAEGGRREGRRGRRGRSHLRDRGHEDGERDHRPERGHRRGARRLRGRLGRHRRHDRRHQVTTFVPAARHLLKAKDLADARYAEPLGVDDLAEAAGLSRAHFSREFRAAFGESPHSYLLTRRMERAAALLRTTDRSVADICLSVGLTERRLVHDELQAHLRRHAHRLSRLVPAGGRERDGASVRRALLRPPAAQQHIWRRQADRALRSVLNMMKIANAQLWVHDQNEALAFYTDKLGWRFART